MAGLLFLSFVVGGCASNKARRHLENVAKDWCETIRASQVIPVYPLTQDLVVGDVFLVQTPISQQESDYERRGFLPLDDHRVRLAYTNFSKLYFDGYWKDEFGKTPNPIPLFTNASDWLSNGPVALTAVPAPRAAFPTYSFHAQSGFGLSSAFPIQSVPVALGYLNSDQVNGSVTIADARTYAGDEGDLYRLLQDWASASAVRSLLAQTVEAAKPTRVYLRVISRVYLARAVSVSLHRSNAQGAGAKAGTGPNAELLKPGGGVNENYTNMLNILNAQAGTLAGAAEIGASIRFVSASESSVGLSESFDRLLAIGYLGFDVPVYAGGVLGVPIPTFKRITGKITREPPFTVGPLTDDQARFDADQLALESVAGSNPKRALALMQQIVSTLSAREFDAVAAALKSADAATLDAAQAEKLAKNFKLAAVNYVSPSGGGGERYSRYDLAFLQAFSKSEKSN